MLLEKNTGVKVLRHSTKKPGCKEEVLAYFRNQPDSGVTSPSHIAVVGDRLFTDVMMANMMGGYGFWIKDGVVETKSFVCSFFFVSFFLPFFFLEGRGTRCGCLSADLFQFARVEDRLSGFLLKRGYSAPDPRSDFE